MSPNRFREKLSDEIADENKLKSPILFANKIAGKKGKKKTSNLIS